MDHDPPLRGGSPLLDLPPIGDSLGHTEGHQKPPSSPLHGNNIVTSNPESPTTEDVEDDHAADPDPDVTGGEGSSQTGDAAVEEAPNGNEDVPQGEGEGEDGRSPDTSGDDPNANPDPGVSQADAGPNSDTDDNKDQTNTDLFDRIPSMYRLLDLLYEVGSNGLVEKIIVDHKSLGSLLNKMLPGSFQSISRIDFKSLDALKLDPIGVYGSRSEIAKFLQTIGAVDEEVAHLLAKPQQASSAEPSLRSGLYLVLQPSQSPQPDQSRQAYLIYWPESTTWRDNANPAIEQNRVTFMRYLTQLADQIFALVSEEEASLFDWDPTSQNSQKSGPTQASNVSSRVRTFRVQKTENQEENVTARTGFRVNFPRTFVEKKVQLIGGETTSGLLVSSFEGPKTTRESASGIYSSMRLSKVFDQPVVLGSRLNDTALGLLMDHGLRDKHPDLFAQYDRLIAETRAKRDAEKAAESARIRDHSEQERSTIEQRLRKVFRDYCGGFGVYLATEPGPDGGAQPGET